jgi:hypothetical protein
MTRTGRSAVATSFRAILVALFSARVKRLSSLDLPTLSSLLGRETARNIRFDRARRMEGTCPTRWGRGKESLVSEPEEASWEVGEGGRLSKRQDVGSRAGGRNCWCGVSMVEVEVEWNTPYRSQQCLKT